MVVELHLPFADNVGDFDRGGVKVFRYQSRELAIEDVLAKLPPTMGGIETGRIKAEEPPPPGPEGSSDPFPPPLPPFLDLVVEGSISGGLADALRTGLLGEVPRVSIRTSLMPDEAEVESIVGVLQANGVTDGVIFVSEPTD